MPEIKIDGENGNGEQRKGHPADYGVVFVPRALIVFARLIAPDVALHLAKLKKVLSPATCALLQEYQPVDATVNKVLDGGIFPVIAAYSLPKHLLNESIDRDEAYESISKVVWERINTSHLNPTLASEDGVAAILGVIFFQNEIIDFNATVVSNTFAQMYATLNYAVSYEQSALNERMLIPFALDILANEKLANAKETARRLIEHPAVMTLANISPFLKDYHSTLANFGQLVMGQSPYHKLDNGELGPIGVCAHKIIPNLPELPVGFSNFILHNYLEVVFVSYILMNLRPLIGTDWAVTGAGTSNIF